MRTAGLWLACLLAAVPGPAPAAVRAEPPVLRASSPVLDVRDGDRVLKGGWRADPRTPIDVFNARRGRAGRRVTFVSDRDSLSFDVRPGERREFVVLLNGRDTCRTQVSTMTDGFTRAGSARTAGPDTIPISIARGKIHLRGTFNGSKPLDLIFDTGADMCVLYPSAMAKGARLQIDGVVENEGTGGSTRRERSDGTRLEVAGLRWEHEPAIYVEKQADRADGIVGYPVFEDKVVEFDFVRGLMVVRDSLAAPAAGFRETSMTPAGTLTAVDAGLGSGTARASGPFVLDTASNGTLIVTRAFMEAKGLGGALRKLGTSGSRGVGRAVVRNEVDLLPALSLAGFTLRDVPIDAERDLRAGTGAAGGTVGMAVLGRFDMVLDYPNGKAWFRPNARFHDRFPARGTGGRTLALVAIATAIATALAAARGRSAQTDGNPAA